MTPGLALRQLAWNSVLAYGRAAESLIAFGGPLPDLRLDRPTVHRFVPRMSRGKNLLNQVFAGLIFVVAGYMLYRSVGPALT